MTLLICVIVFVVLLIAAKLLLSPKSYSKVDGVRVSLADQKRFAGFHVAIDTDLDEVTVVGRDYWAVRQEVADRGLLYHSVIIALPGEQNEILAELVDPTPVVRRYDDATND